MKRVLGAAIGGLLLVSMPAWSAPLMIGPLRLELNPRTRVTSVTLSNQGNEGVNIQARVETWSQSPGAAVATPSDDIIISPPISALPPHRTQIFRVALRHPLTPGPERGYRVILADVTPANAGPPGAPAISFRIAQSLPLYVVTDSGGKPALNVGPCAAKEPKSVCVQITNTGTVHTSVEKINFKSGAWSANLLPRASLLAGGTLSFSIGKPPNFPRDAVVQVTVTGDGASATGSVGGAGG